MTRPSKPGFPATCKVCGKKPDERNHYECSPLLFQVWRFVNPCRFLGSCPFWHGGAKSALSGFQTDPSLSTLFSFSPSTPHRLTDLPLSHWSLLDERVLALVPFVSLVMGTVSQPDHCFLSQTEGLVRSWYPSDPSSLSLPRGTIGPALLRTGTCYSALY